MQGAGDGEDSLTARRGPALTRLRQSPRLPSAALGITSEDNPPTFSPLPLVLGPKTSSWLASGSRKRMGLLQALSPGK